MPPASAGRNGESIGRLTGSNRTSRAQGITTAGIVWFVRQDTTRRAERAVGFHARVVADTVLRDRVLAYGTATPASRAELDSIVRREILVEGAIRATLYDRSGRVSFTSSSARGGAPVRSVQRALAGATTTTVMQFEPTGKALAAFAPLRTAAGRVIGAFELDQDYAPVAASARSAFMPVAGALALALLLLYGSLFPILRRLTRRLRRQIEEIEHQALHDALTGLPNRRLFQEQVEHGLRIERRPRHGLAVLLIDLDRFKEINDALGHASGDTLLVEVAGRLRSTLRESDAIARLGGDEFAVLALGIAGEDDARAAAERVHAALVAPVVIGGISLDVACSIGIALAALEDGDVTELIRRADTAMYASKQLLERTIVYRPGEDTHTPERLSLVSDLGRAVERGQLELVYQPQVDLCSGGLRGVEALMRWQHSERGAISPGEFIPLAEHTGLIRPLTSWALHEAIRQASAWSGRGIDIAVAVNLSARDIIDLSLPAEVDELIRRFFLAPSLLELEITGSAILTDPTRAHRSRWPERAGRAARDRRLRQRLHLARLSEAASGRRPQDRQLLRP